MDKMKTTNTYKELLTTGTQKKRQRKTSTFNVHYVAQSGNERSLKDCLTGWVSASQVGGYKVLKTGRMSRSGS